MSSTQWTVQSRRLAKLSVVPPYAPLPIVTVGPTHGSRIVPSADGYRHKPVEEHTFVMAVPLASRPILTVSHHCLHYYHRQPAQ